MQENLYRWFNADCTGNLSLRFQHFSLHWICALTAGMRSLQTERKGLVLWNQRIWLNTASATYLLGNFRASFELFESQDAPHDMPVQCPNVTGVWYIVCSDKFLFTELFIYFMCMSRPLSAYMPEHQRRASHPTIDGCKDVLNNPPT